MKRMLSLSMRPKTLDDMVGQDKLIARIRKRMKKRHTTASMFVGETGSGKTTIVRIIALSLQCTHQKVFGRPCKDCRKNSSKFDITEINASDLTGIDELRHAVEGADYLPRHGSRYRVYILDELHMASKSAQNMLLKYLEDSPSSTVFLICTTESKKILRTLRTRCAMFSLKSLDDAGLRDLISRTLKKLNVDEDKYPIIPLAEALWENGISSARLAVQAIDNYLSGATAEEAAQVEESSDFNTRAVTASMVKGDWDGCRELLRVATKDDARSIRSASCAFLSTILLDSESIDDNGIAVAKAIEKMSVPVEDSILLALIRSQVYQLCKIFKRHSR